MLARNAVPIVVLMLLLVVGSCHSCPTAAKPDPWSKITFDVARLNDDGLAGPPDGLRALSYEFCIPDRPECRAEVRSIDPTVELMPGSRGRIGCTAGQCLCIGSTHQKDFRDVLRRLAVLDYVKRIDECFFE